MNPEHQTKPPAGTSATEAATGSHPPQALDRRGFVLAALSAPALAAAAVGAQVAQASQAGQAEAPQAAPGTPGHGGSYHETEHIRRYYALAAY